MNVPRWIAVAAFLLALAVGLGAFAAHTLKGKLDPYSQEVYGKAVFYHCLHAIGVFLVALLPALDLLPLRAANTVCTLLAAGVLLFSGSLYLLAITRISWLGAITPFGGVAFIVGWLALGVAMLRR